MSRVLVLGAGISGHTAAAFLRKWLPERDEVVVISPQPEYNWIPSNIWVGVGLLRKEQVLVSLAPIYQRHQIEFKQARAVALFPEGDEGNPESTVEIEWTLDAKRGQREKIAYDFLINATRSQAQFRCDHRAGPRQEQPVCLHGGPCGGDFACFSRNGRTNEARREKAVPGWRRPRRVHLRRRRLRVRRQPGV